jgi:hypothetical protein
LPAPLYFIDTADAQIWRIERDGQTRTQITSEVAVEYFDVSPVTGELAYVSHNTLLRTDALGGSRVAVLTGPAIAPDNYLDLRTRAITDPLWSPDGNQIAYYQNGVNVIRPAGDAAAALLTNTASPEEDPSIGRGEARFYRPLAWSPDGTRILVSVAYYPEGGEFNVLAVSTTALTQIDNTYVIGHTSWTPDSRHVYFANEYVGLFDSGLWRADAATGSVETLIQGYTGQADQPPDEDDLYQYAAFARELSDGQLYAFIGSEKAAALAVVGGAPRLTMTRISPADAANRAALRADSHILREALWADDASGAVVVDATNQPAANQWSPVGQLVWLSADDGPALTLPGEGSVLRWGR